MVLPSEKLAHATSSAAARALLRLVAVWLGCGLLDLAAAGLHALIVATVDRGDGTGAMAALTLFYRPDAGGERWLTAFLVLALAVALARGGALWWVVSRGTREDSPVILLLVGLAGLIASGFAYWVSFTTSFGVSQLGAEALADYSIAANVAGTATSIFELGLGLVVLFVVFVRTFARPPTPSRAGPYREPTDE